jgi:hypothetical protein
MSKLIIITTFSLLTLLTGCKEEAKTSKWYRAHPDELKTVYDQCQKTGDASENCKNANEAHYQIQQLNAPSMKFSE